MASLSAWPVAQPDQLTPTNGVHGRAADLTTNIGDGHSYALDNNNSGTAVGYLGRDGNTHAIRMDHGRVTDLTPTAGYASATAINDAGTAVGQVMDSKGIRAVAWDRRGHQTDVVIPGATYSIAFGLNNRGQIVGGWSGQNGWHSFLYDRGRLSEPIPGGTAEAINDRGTIAGRDRNNAPVTVTSQGSTTNLEQAAPGQFTLIRDINNRGQVSGVAVDQPARWEPNGHLTELPPLPGTTHGEGYEINEQGHVAGYTRDAMYNAHATVWK